ncbi:MAG: phosphate acyltransferase PlsX [Clostridia bacterium]|nr:phosphate acyltransferase PlsX [Clostridia bacterium]
MIILVDAMGGDNAPDAIVNGCIDAVLEKDGFDILLIGDSERINKVLKERDFSNPRLTVRHTTEVITGDDTPTKAIKNKKDSSMVVGFNLLKEKKGDVFLSAGNSGALMTGALFILGRIKGIDRPALPALIPAKGGDSLIIDAGLNTVCKPVNYLQFGVMGSIYMKELFNIEKPRVGLMNVGTEVGKGSDDIKQAYTLLSESNLNFIGNIEGKDINRRNADVAVCDGFVGNVALKANEGMGEYFLENLVGIFKTNFITKLAYLAIKKPFKEFYKRIDPDVNGGAPVLGVNGLVIKSHGSSKAKTIKNVIINRAYVLAKSSVLEQITEQFKNMEVEDIEQ